jgi:hypothetical protein
MNTSTALDTIAGSKLLQLRFGRAADFQPNQAVIHDDRRARFIRISDGDAFIQYWGEDCPVAVPLGSISLPPAQQDDPALRAPALAHARRSRSANGPRLVSRVHLRWAPRRRPLLRP